MLVALTTRLLVLWLAVHQYPHNWLYGRGIELGTLAESLATGHGLASPFGGSTGATALLAPGYPLLIAVIFHCFGSFSFAAAISVMVMQLLFGVATVLLIIQVAGQCFGPRAANVAGAFWAVSLPLLWMHTIFWDTCLSTLLLLSIITLAMRCNQGTAAGEWAAMGACGGFAALVNPALLLSLLAVMAWACWNAGKLRSRSPILVLLALLLVYAPWPIRNARVLGAFTPLRSTLGYELWVGNRAGATGYLDQSTFPIFNRAEYQQYVALGEVRYMRNKAEQAKAYIRAYPLVFLRMTTVRTIRFWMGTGSEGGSIFFAVHALLTTCLGLVGMVSLWRTRRYRLGLLFLLPLLLFPLPYYVTHAEFRYRLVIDPLLTILGAFAVTSRFSQHCR